VRIHSSNPLGQSILTNAKKWLFSFILYDTISDKMTSSWTCVLWILSVYVFTNLLNPGLAIHCATQFLLSSSGTNCLRYWPICCSPVILSGFWSPSHLCACRDIFEGRPSKSQGSQMMKYLPHLYLYQYKWISPTYLQCISQVKQVGDLILCWPLCTIPFSLLIILAPSEFDIKYAVYFVFVHGVSQYLEKSQSW
jgi:hypothetical protein